VTQRWRRTDGTRVGLRLNPRRSGSGPRNAQNSDESGFTRSFVKPKPMRTLTEIRQDIEPLERETDGFVENLPPHIVFGGYDA
jgi:hypothetical protein